MNLREHKNLKYLKVHKNKPGLCLKGLPKAPQLDQPVSESDQRRKSDNLFRLKLINKKVQQ